ncbi:hypothetical protein CLF_106227, partial [Clonorchis sinensis]
NGWRYGFVDNLQQSEGIRLTSHLGRISSESTVPKTVDSYIRLSKNKVTINTSKHSDDRYFSVVNGEGSLPAHVSNQSNWNIIELGYRAAVCQYGDCSDLELLSFVWRMCIKVDRYADQSRSPKDRQGSMPFTVNNSRTFESTFTTMQVAIDHMIFKIIDSIEGNERIHVTPRQQLLENITLKVSKLSHRPDEFRQLITTKFGLDGNEGYLIRNCTCADFQGHYYFPNDESLGRFHHSHPLDFDAKSCSDNPQRSGNINHLDYKEFAETWIWYAGPPFTEESVVFSSERLLAETVQAVMIGLQYCNDPSFGSVIIFSTSMCGQMVPEENRVPAPVGFWLRFGRNLPAIEPPEGSATTKVVPDYPSLDRSSRDVEVGFEPGTIWSKLALKAVLLIIRRTFSRITRMDFRELYGTYVRPLLEYANKVVYSGRTKNITRIEHFQ